MAYWWKVKQQGDISKAEAIGLIFGVRHRSSRVLVTSFEKNLDGVEMVLKSNVV